jgi:hypothetical protein
VAHAGLRALLAGLRRQPASPPQALMAELPGDAERGLLAALLMEERQWPDLPGQIQEFRKRAEIRRRKKQIREVSQAIARAQATGDPALPQLEDELRSLQQQAEAVRELALSRPAAPHSGSPYTP